MIDAILAYPPAIRVLKLLSMDDDAHLTKFEIGKQLGFVGEDGFTSMPQKLLIQALSECETAKERNSMKADWEGSSDKYARMIAGWLEKLGLVKKAAKTVMVKIGKEEYTDTIGQAYMITAAGLTALRRSQGKSKHKRIAKNVCWEMFATKGCDREYIRTRRALILKCLCENTAFVPAEKLVALLSGNGETIETICDDINGFINIGMDITIKSYSYKLNDLVNEFTVPITQKLVKSDLSAAKDELRSKLSAVPHEYLSLLDMAYDSTQNRLFEMKTLELLTDECKFKGLHLGGSRKPDGIIYTDDLIENYGVIIDTKAYPKGYNLPISQADEMERYIGENQTRDEMINPNKWWENFESGIESYYFMFVSGHFKGNFVSQIQRISRNKNVNGAAVSITNLLLMTELYKRGLLTHETVGKTVFVNAQYQA